MALKIDMAAPAADDIAARCFPDAPLAMPEQDMSPAQFGLPKAAVLVATLRRLVTRNGAIRN